MQKRLLVLLLLLMVSCTHAMENDDSETKKESEKVSLFNEIAKGMGDKIDFPAFCADFKRQLEDGTINPNETHGDIGFSGLDILTEIYVFDMNSSQNRAYRRSKTMKPSLAMYELLLQSKDFDSKVSHSYKIERTPSCCFYLCAEQEKECKLHSGFIQTVENKVFTHLRNYPIFNVNNVTHEQVLEILSCAIPKVHLVPLFNPKQKERSDTLKLKFDEIKNSTKRKEEAKLTMLCLKENEYGADLMQPIASMVLTGRSDAFKEDKNGANQQ